MGFPGEHLRVISVTDGMTVEEAHQIMCEKLKVTNKNDFALYFSSTVDGK
jgi:hypothetical protein